MGYHKKFMLFDSLASAQLLVSRPHSDSDKKVQ